MNPKNVSAMTLRTRKKIEGPKHVVSKNKINDQIEKELEEEARNEMHQPTVEAIQCHTRNRCSNKGSK